MNPGSVSISPVDSDKWLVDSFVKCTFLGLILIAFASIAFSQRPVTIFLAGDSTMAKKAEDKRPETGWGEKLEAHFKAGTVKVENRAMNGRSTKSFIDEGRWQKIIDDLRKGDWVFIEFGHNDEKKESPDRYASPEDYRKNLIRFISDVKAKHGNPLMMTPVMRRRFDKDGKFYDTHGEYPDVVRSVATEYKVPLIDMHKLSEVVIVKYGEEGSKKLFLQLKQGENANYPKGVEDNTHFSPLGAEEMAAAAVAEIKVKQIGLCGLIR
jgi:lysophospholipase L1-like esterase